jgi:hypothetical protein
VPNERETGRCVASLQTAIDLALQFGPPIVVHQNNYRHSMAMSPLDQAVKLDNLER